MEPGLQPGCVRSFNSGVRRRVENLPKPAVAA